MSGSGRAAPVVQSIAGVSPTREATVDICYPSMARTAIGEGLHSLYESLPVLVGTIRWSHLLFVVPTIPVALVVYLGMKVLGERYVVTNRRVVRETALGSRVRTATDLSAIGRVVVDSASQRPFFRTADVLLLDRDGQVLDRLRGVPNPGQWASVIEESAQAVRLVSQAQAQIARRAASA